VAKPSYNETRHSGVGGPEQPRSEHDTSYASVHLSGQSCPGQDLGPPPVPESTSHPEPVPYEQLKG
jgi:hypothetical protein